MDFLCLWLTAKLLHRPFPIGRAVAAAAIGGGYALISLIGSRELGTIGLAAELLIPALLTFLVFGRDSLGRFLARYALFWGISFATGGAMTALYYGVNRLLGYRRLSVNGTIQEVYSEVPLWVFALLAAVCALISAIWGRIAARNRGKRSVGLEIFWHSGGRSVKLTALVDSGNLLTEPLGGLPVILLTADHLREILPSGLASICLRADVEAAAGVADGRRIRLIPYRSVGGGGLMIGCLPDRILIDGRPVAACIATASEGENRDFSGYGAIVPSCL